VQSRTFETVAIPPDVAGLLGQSQGIIDAYISERTSDISAQFVKDFRAGKTASIAYARGISPGNGLFLTSTQESIVASTRTPFARIYNVGANFGRDTLLSVGQLLGKYQSEYVSLSISRKFRRGMSLDFQAEFRHFQVADLLADRNQLRITSGLTWGSTTGRLWPF
jgi:hypothetical protein